MISENNKYDVNLVRSATAPLTMVAVVAQNTVWNNKNAQLKPTEFPVSFAISDEPSNIKKFVPKYPFDTPNIKPKPNNQKMTDPIETSIKFFMIILHTFFALVNPASTNANPACIKNTKNAAIQVHKMFESSLRISNVSILTSLIPIFNAVEIVIRKFQSVN